MDSNCFSTTFLISKIHLLPVGRVDLIEYSFFVASGLLWNILTLNSTLFTPGSSGRDSRIPVGCKNSTDSLLATAEDTNIPITVTDNRMLDTFFILRTFWDTTNLRLSDSHPILMWCDWNWNKQITLSIWRCQWNRNFVTAMNGLSFMFLFISVSMIRISIYAAMQTYSVLYYTAYMFPFQRICGGDNGIGQQIGKPLLLARA